MLSAKCHPVCKVLPGGCLSLSRAAATVKRSTKTKALRSAETHVPLIKLCESANESEVDKKPSYR